jgi:hypothetical protein
MLLITDYHKYGSLYDFLKNNTIDEDRMVYLLTIISFSKFCDESNKRDYLNLKINDFSFKSSTLSMIVRSV